MSAKHTPTPWDFTAEPGIGVYVHATDEFTTDVAEMICAGHSDEAVVANARLIAAAPELLEFVMGWLDRQGTDNNYMTSKARSAIAKATGGKA